MKRTSLSFRYIRQDELLQLDVQWIPEEDGCNRGIFWGSWPWKSWKIRQ